MELSKDWAKEGLGKGKVGGRKGWVKERLGNLLKEELEEGGVE